MIKLNFLLFYIFIFLRKNKKVTFYDQTQFFTFLYFKLIQKKISIQSKKNLFVQII